MHVILERRHARARCWACADIPMGVLSIALVATVTSDTKLSLLTQVCSAYSWLNVGGKLLKLLALNRLFAEEADTKRKLQKHSGRGPCSTRLAIEIAVSGVVPVYLQPLARPSLPMPLSRPSLILLRAKLNLVAHGTGGRSDATASSHGSRPCCMVRPAALTVRTLSW
jgi:hypothetical protein